jgi:uncharacterized protein (DUF427 family)
VTERKVLQPSDEHPITIRRTGGRVVIRRGDAVVVDTRDALTLQEASYPPVQYVPRKDVDLTLLERSQHSTYCPFKGDAAYFSLPGVPEAVWTYESPYPAVAEIQDHLAFYPQHVDIEILEVDAA